MFVRHGCLNVLRSWKKALLYFLLLALTTAMLGTSLGMTFTVRQALERCRESYTTIGLVEYLGENYPDVTRIGDGKAQTASLFEQSSARKDDAVLAWQREERATAYVLNAESRFSVNAVRKNAVFLVSVAAGLEPSTGAYTTTIERTLFADRDYTRTRLYVTCDLMPLVAGRCYLIHGTFVDGPTQMKYFEVSPYLEGVEESAVLDLGQRAAYKEDCLLSSIAQSYAVMSNAVELRAMEDLSSYLPFQQQTLYLTQGRYFTTQERQTCILSEQLAQTIGVGLFDTVQLGIRTQTTPFLIDDGFDLTAQYTVIGLFCAQDGWNETIFLPPQENVSMQAQDDSYTIGQLRLKNESAQAFAASAELPPRVRITVYDQGYAAAAEPLENMLRTVRLISAVCLCAGFGFLLLFAYLTVYRQRRIGSTMLRVGASTGNVCVYFFSGAALIALPACALGAGCSALLSGKMVTLVDRTLAAASRDMRYSNSNLTMRLALSSFASPPRLALFVVIGCAVCLLCLLACLLLARLSVKRRRKVRTRRLRGGAVRSRDLSGGAMKYALLSAVRGGPRSALPVVAVLCAALLFARFSLSLTNCRRALSEIRSNTEIRGYFTDIHGKTPDQLALDADTVRTLASFDGVTSLTATISEPCHFAFGTHGTDHVGPGFTDVPQGSFAKEYATGLFLTQNPRLVFTNGLRDAPAFLFSPSLEVSFLDGYDEGSLKKLHDETVCVMPKRVMEAYGLSLGDEVTYEVMFTHIAQSIDSLYYLPMRVIGCYTDALGGENVYANLPAFYGCDPIEEPELLPNTYFAAQRLQSAVFRVKNGASLSTFKDMLAQAGFCEPNQVGRLRTWLLVEDAAYHATEKSVSQRLWYMEHIFPAVELLTLALAPAFAFLQAQMRKKEQRMMRCVGASAGRALCSLLLEQVLLLLPVGAAALLICRLLHTTLAAQYLTAAFVMLWLLGALLSFLRGGNLLKKRREGET